ncbi:MAG: hypothetical protein CMJ54_04385, partial [Planctomycetaceae bacterium]|nr:hypothetical protein [Planctomycetaceae bacterium]
RMILRLVRLDGSGGRRATSRGWADTRVTTHLLEASRARLRHGYELKRGSTLLSTATTSLACVDADGSLREIPIAPD